MNDIPDLAAAPGDDPEPLTAGEILTGLTPEALGRDVATSVEQTGGGVATIYVETPDGSRALIGPGTYEWDAPSYSAFWPEALCVGPDDEGVGPVAFPTTVEEIAAAVRRSLNGEDPRG